MMAESIKATGRMASNTAMVNFSTLRKAYGNEEFGAKAEESNGKILLLLSNFNL
jgi:hypothetical protein